MTTEKFRRQLRQESEHWWQEGRIDATFYQHLAERYQFSNIEASNQNRFITILLGLGGILMGLGVITFVAANWEDWSRPVRVGLLFAAFAGFNISGFYLWRRPSQLSRQRLGHGLLLTGALVLGANLGLMSQMFHQSGAIYELFCIWGLGVLLMAYCLRLPSMGVLAWILIMLGYWNWEVWGRWEFANPSGLRTLMFYLPILITLGFLPLAHWCRSRPLFTLWGIGFATTFVFSQQPIVAWTQTRDAWGIAWMSTLPAAFLWVYHTQFWQWPPRKVSLEPATMAPASTLAGARQRSEDRFQSLGRALAIWITSLTVYWFSFRWLWRANIWGSSIPGPEDIPIPSHWFSWTLLGYGLLAAYGWWQWFGLRRNRLSNPSLWLRGPVLLGLLALIWGVMYFHLRGATFSVIGPVAMNGVLFLLALLLLHDGLAEGVRHRFWGGMVLLVLGITSRMFEYNTDLILKALVLIGCGIGIILAGIWFERLQKPKHRAIAAL
jgi:uncharacterized membrane protein